MSEKSHIFITNSISSINVNNSKIKPKKENLLGERYFVYPVIMIKEGAYYPSIENASDKYALYFPGAELKKSLNSWRGRPAALNHPTDSESFNSPQIFDNQWIGFVFNVRYDTPGKKLISDLWLHEQRGEKIVKELDSGKNIDVSIGAYGDIVNNTGEINGVKYENAMVNIIGDHLAILPDNIGACNWEDGCGIRTNNERDGDIMNDEIVCINGSCHCTLNNEPVLILAESVLAIWDETENQIRFRLRDPDDFRPDTFRTKKLSGVKGISIVIGRLKASKVPKGHDPESAVVQSYRFEKKTEDNPGGWTMSEAKEWIKENVDVNAELVDNILGTSRTPSYTGKESIDWGEVKKEIGDYVNGYFKATGKSKPEDFPGRVQDFPQAVKSWIASKSLLGDPKSDMAEDLLFFPVVNPNTNKLNEFALKAVISGRGAQADIPEAAKTSAQNKARDLLEKEFGMGERETKQIAKNESAVENIESNTITNKKSQVTLEEYLNNAPDDIKGALVDAVRERNLQRDKLINFISAYDEVKFSDGFLASSDTNVLKGIACLIDKIQNANETRVNAENNVDFSLKGYNQEQINKTRKYVPITPISWA